MVSRILLALALVFFGRAEFAAAQFVTGGSVGAPGAFGFAGAPGTVGGPIQVMLVPEGGAPGSQAFDDDPLAGPLFGEGARVDLGFEYLRPHYSNGATTLVVPPNAAAAFPIRGTLGDVTHDFAFIPRFGIEYTFPNTAGLGVGASGKLFTLHGDLRRTLAGSGGSGVLNAENTLNIGSANVLEGLIRFDLGRLEACHDTFLENLTLMGSLGGRYGYVQQNFTASLVSGSNQTSLTSTQEFTGFGVTGSIGSLYLLGESKRFGLYGLSRGSVLTGGNNRSSTYSTMIAGDAVNSSSGQATERVTKLITVGEFEMGMTWGLPIPVRSRGTAASLPPILFVRTGGVLQFWGGLGLPPPPTNSTFQSGVFSDSTLVLYGFTIQAGFNF